MLGSGIWLVEFSLLGTGKMLPRTKEVIVDHIPKLCCLVG